jgi:hypothetical protein
MLSGIAELRKPVHRAFTTHSTGRRARHTLPRKFAKSEEENLLCPFRKAVGNLLGQGRLGAAGKRGAAPAAVVAPGGPATPTSSRS